MHVIADGVASVGVCGMSSVIGGGGSGGGDRAVVSVVSLTCASYTHLNKSARLNTLEQHGPPMHNQEHMLARMSSVVFVVVWCRCGVVGGVVVAVVLVVYCC